MAKSSFASKPLIEYRVNSKKYYAKAPRLKYLSPGDKFVLRYDSLNPSSFELLFEYPLFLSDENGVHVKGTVRKCISGEYYSKVLYEFLLDGKKYRKLQFFPGYYYAKRGTSCEIVYAKSNPRRSKLLAVK